MITSKLSSHSSSLCMNFDIFSGVYAILKDTHFKFCFLYKHIKRTSQEEQVTECISFERVMPLFYLELALKLYSCVMT